MKKINIYENLVIKLKQLTEKLENDKKTSLEKQEVLLKMKDSLIEKIESELLKSIEKSNKKQNDWAIDDDFEDFEEKYNNSLSDLDSLNQQISQIMTENARLKIEHGKIENENEMYRNELKGKDVSQKLEINLNEWKINNEKLEKEVMDEQELNNKLIQNLNALREENSELEKSVLKEQMIGKLFFIYDVSRF